MAFAGAAEALLYTKQETAKCIRRSWNEVTVTYNKNEPGKSASFVINREEDIIQLQFLLTCRYKIVKSFLAEKGISITYRISDHDSCDISVKSGPQPQPLKTSFMSMLKSHFLPTCSPFYILDANQCYKIRNKFSDHIPKVVEDKRAFLIEIKNGIVCLSDSNEVQDELLRDIDIKVRSHFTEESDLLADYIRKFGDKLIGDCKSKFDVDLIVCARNVILEGNIETSFDSCKTFIRDRLKGQCALIPLLASDFQLSNGIIQSVTENKRCCWKLHSMVERNINRECYAEFKDPYGPFQLCIMDIGADIKTDVVIILTTDMLFTPAHGYWKNGTKIKRNVGEVFQVPLNETTLNEHVCCDELWSVVCVQMEDQKVSHVIKQKNLQQAVEKILQRAEQMHFSDLCIVASLLDIVGQHLPLTAFAKILFAASSSLGPFQRMSLDLRLGKEFKPEVIQAFDSAFNAQYKKYKKTPVDKGSKAFSAKVQVVLGKVQETKADVIVCTSDSNLSFKGRSAQEILKMAGEEMVQECEKKYPNGIPSCSVAYTRSYKLKQKNVKYIFHIALPKYSVMRFQQVKKVVKSCLYLAEELGCTSIAFPALGVGGLKYPRRETAFQMFEGVRDYNREVSHSKLKLVKIVCFEKDVATCKAFSNEEHRRSSKQEVVEERTTYSGGENRLFIKDATEKPATWNDQINLPMEIEVILNDVILLIDEERMTHVIFKLDLKTVPDWKLTKMTMTMLEAIATSSPRYLRIVDLVLPDRPRLDLFLSRSGVTQWMSVIPQDEPNYFLELITESKECLEKICTTIESNIYEAHKAPISLSVQETLNNPTCTSLAPLKLKDDHGTHGQHISDLSTFNTVKDAKLDPLNMYATIDEINANATFHQTGQSVVSKNAADGYNKSINDDPTYAKLDEYRMNSTSQKQQKQMADYSDTAMENDAAVPNSSTTHSHDWLKKTSAYVTTTVREDISMTNDKPMHDSEVSALINYGIVNYIEQRNKLRAWISSVQKRYGVRICGQFASYTVYGDFDNIIAFENYLEKGFPDESLELDDLDICDNYFSVDNTMQLKMSNLQFDYVQILCRNWLAKPTARFSYNSGCLSAEGSANETENLRINITKCLQFAGIETVVYNTPEEATKAVQIVDTDHNDTLSKPDENNVLIIGSINNVGNAFRKLITCTHMRTVRKFYSNSKLLPLSLKVMQGDIRNANAKFIAVASTATMTEQKGAGRQIRDMLGEKYLKECELSIQRDGIIQHGECRVIATGLCVRKWIGNVSVPTRRKDRANQTEEAAVVTAYSNCFSEADNKRCDVMAMTCIGSDLSRGGFPLEECASWLCQSIESFKPTHLKKILLIECDGEKVPKIADFITQMSKWECSTPV